ncbi:APC family permease [Streptomyces parvulus]|uniref:APC family permease n=1 Tax=Streptomyces parvulus TaxID=146923 RepID=UPI00342862E1
MTVQDQQRGAEPEASRLRGNSIGALGMTSLAVAATAPLTAMTSNVSLSLGFGVGAGTVGLMLVVGALLAVFAVGYVVLSRYVTNAGAYYAFISYGLGRATGSAGALVAALAYNLASAGMIAATGYFTNIAVTSYGGPSVPWWAYGAAALAITFFLGVRGVDVAQVVTALIAVVQFAAILLLGVAVLVRSPENWSAEVFAPSEMFHGNVALTLVFCLLCFGGFEATAIYGEEAKAPRRSIKIATYAALLILLLVFCFSTWSLTAAFDDVQGEAAKDPGALVFTAATVYLGDWAGSLLSALVSLSFLASAVAFHNMAARYMFSLGRPGLLPGFLCRVHHRHGTPHAAAYTQAALSLLVLIPFVIAEADPITNLFPAVSGITSLALLALMAGCCASVVSAALRGRLTESRWATVVAPGIAGLGILAIAVIVVTKYRDVTGSDSLAVALMPVLPVAAALYGAFASRRRPDVLLDQHLAEKST